MKDKYNRDPSYRERLAAIHGQNRGKNLEEILGVRRARSTRRKLSRAASLNAPLIKEKQALGYIRHRQAILDLVQKYQENGFVCAPVSNEFPRPDIVAFKDGKVYAIEVERETEGVNPSKYLNLPVYADIMWHVYTSK